MASKANTKKDRTNVAHFDLEQSNHVLNEIHDAVIATNLESKITFWNKGAQRQFGFSPEEIIGKSIYALYPDESSTYSMDDVVSILKIDDTFEIETIMRTNSNRFFYCDSFLSLLRDNDDQPIGIISYSIDITKRKWAEMLLSTEKEIFEYVSTEPSIQKCFDFVNKKIEILLPNTNSSICLLNEDSTYFECCSAPDLPKVFTNRLLKIDLTSDNTIYGKTIRENKCIVIDDMNTSSLWNNECYSPLKLKNKACWSTPILTTNNNVLGLFINFYHEEKKPNDLDTEAIKRLTNIVRNIIESKRHEIALINNEARFRDLVNNIPGVVYRCSCDKDWTMNFISEDIEEISGYSYLDFLDNNVRTFDSIIHPEDRANVNEIVQHGVTNRVPYIIEYRIIHRDGDVRWVYEKGQGVFDEKHQLKYLDGVIFDITESHKLTEKLNYYASHDLLTGLINRKEFELRLQRVLDTAHNGTSEHALCYMDLDQFKIINDTCGHIAGDNLLNQLSAEMTKVIRKRDTFARLGGDEFGLLMEHCDLKQAKNIANKLRRLISKYQFVWNERSFNVGVSIGLVPINEASGNKTDVLKQADTACYAAKDAGRNRVHVYHPEDIELAKRHGEMLWVTRINQAIEEDRLLIYFQPIKSIFDENNGRHFEVLIRMQQDGKIISPNYFLPAAERYNLSTKLDKWVVQETFTLLKKNKEFLDDLFLCSINLSGLSLADNKFLQFIIERFKKTDIPPEKICFEITETAAIQNFSNATTFINVLKNLGCKFALDDFGSGLSSFAYLKNLSVDYLKIDGMFVKDICKDPIDLAMVKSINEIGQVMGKKTIAEFVEDENILEILKDIGVNYAQGYGIGKPKEFEL